MLGRNNSNEPTKLTDLLRMRSNIIHPAYLSFQCKHISPSITYSCRKTDKKFKEEQKNKSAILRDDSG